MNLSSQATSAKEVHKALAMRLAKREISDEVLQSVSNRIVHEGLKVVGLDFCPYGICIDYFSDRRISTDNLLADKPFRFVKVFTHGILADDLWRVQVEMHVPEIADMRVRG
ncbi:MAG: hypothetical protein ACRC14_10860 [Paracoccaceae bacterium]